VEQICIVDLSYTDVEIISGKEDVTTTTAAATTTGLLLLLLLQTNMILSVVELQKPDSP